MNKKAKIIIAALIIIFLGLIIYAFAAPSDEESLDNRVQQVEKDKDTSEDKESKEESEEKEEKEETETATSNKKTVKVDDKYNTALALVAKAEKEITQTSYDEAAAAIKLVTDTDTTGLKARMENVAAKLKSDADTKALVEELARQVKEASEKQNITDAISYRDTNDIQNKVDAIYNSELKSTLQSMLDEANKVLNDTTAPVITVVDAENPETIIIDSENLETATNLNELTVSIADDNVVVPTETKDGSEITYSTSITEEGVYTIKAVDAAFNESELVTITVDRTLPQVVEQQQTKAKHNTYDITVVFSEPVKVGDSEEFVNSYKVNKKENDPSTKITFVDAAGNENSFKIKYDNKLEKPKVSYSTTEPTNQDVTVTITAKEIVRPIEGWELSADRKVLTKVVSENTESRQTVTVTDLAGNTKDVTYEVTNIDRVLPEVVTVEQEIVQHQHSSNEYKITVNFSEDVKVGDATQASDTYEMTYTEPVTLTFTDLAGNTNTYDLEWDFKGPELTRTYSTEEITNGDVVVTITANEMIQPVQGWELSADRKSISMTVDHNNTKVHNVIVTDLAGNTTSTNYYVFWIDKDDPVVTGVEEGEYYKTATATITDANIDTITLDDETYVSGTEITVEGAHKLIATDKAGNSTEVNFIIDATAPVVEATYSEYIHKNQQVSSSKFTLTANITDNTVAKVEYAWVNRSLDNVENIKASRWASITPIVDNTDGTFTAEIEKIENTDDKKHLYVRVTDVVGNVSVVEATFVSVNQPN